ncbi:hypothetical protein LWI29_023862 [Acer saccharum]|uniref:Uncharacterized protein n=1 Tax=Acer saccharum TaxID=4024 RepID=A0AA39SA40_ACESA|nr:hypothetical protein LWI29_023862 [Acer saccharum]
MASSRAYIGEDRWSHFRTGTVSDRLRNFFNSASYMVAEMSGACQAGEAQAEKIRRLEAQLKESEDHCSRAELARQEEARSSEMLVNQCLARQMEAEQRASSAAEEAPMTLAFQASIYTPRCRLMMGMERKRRLCNEGYGFVMIYGEDMMIMVNLWRI